MEILSRVDLWLRSTPTVDYDLTFSLPLHSPYHHITWNECGKNCSIQTVKDAPKTSVKRFTSWFLIIGALLRRFLFHDGSLFEKPRVNEANRSSWQGSIGIATDSQYQSDPSSLRIRIIRALFPALNHDASSSWCLVPSGTVVFSSAAQQARDAT